MGGWSCFAVTLAVAAGQGPSESAQCLHTCRSQGKKGCSHLQLLYPQPHPFYSSFSRDAIWMDAIWEGRNQKGRGRREQTKL